MLVLAFTVLLSLVSSAIIVVVYVLNFFSNYKKFKAAFEQHHNCDCCKPMILEAEAKKKGKPKLLVEKPEKELAEKRRKIEKLSGESFCLTHDRSAIASGLSTWCRVGLSHNRLSFRIFGISQRPSLIPLTRPQLRTTSPLFRNPLFQHRPKQF